MLINTTEGRQAIEGTAIRCAARRMARLPYYTTLRVRGPSCRRWRGFAQVSLVAPLQSYFAHSH